MSKPLVPFDRHRADTADLESCGANLVAQAAEGLNNGSLTKQAYEPAHTAVRGVCRPQIANADRAVQEGSKDVTAKLAWAAIASRYWGTQVTDFNAEVDRITSTLATDLAVDDDDHDGKKRELRQDAKAAWWRAHETFIENGRATTKAMLRDGPTRGHLQTAIDAGAMPPMEWGVSFNDWWSSFSGIFVPPYQKDLVDNGIWAGKTTTLVLAFQAVWNMEFAGKRYLPVGWHRGPDGKLVYGNRFAGSPWSTRARAWADPNNWQDKRAGSSAATRAASWATTLKWADRSFYALGFVGGAYDQWSRDAHRTDLTDTAKVARAGTRSVAVGAGILAGVKIGATVGTAIGGPVGTLVGAGLGLALGALGSAYGNEIADWVVDDFGEAADMAAEKLGDLGESISEGWNDLWS
ncbi:MAG: hypothetical protein ACRDO7_09130 [Nocardioidaceae bacterium]